MHAHACLSLATHTPTQIKMNFPIITQMPLYMKITLTSGQLAARRRRLRRRRPGSRKVSLDRATRREGRGVHSRSPTAIYGIPRRAGKWLGVGFAAHASNPQENIYIELINLHSLI